MGRGGSSLRIFVLHVLKEKHHKLKFQLLTLGFRVYLPNAKSCFIFLLPFFPALHFN